MMHAIIEQALIALPLVVGGYVILSLLKLPDFSLESAYLFGAVGAFLAKELPLAMILICAIGAGMIVAMIVTSLNQLLQIPFLLAAIVTNGLFHGLALALLHTSTASFQVTYAIDERLLLGTLSVSLVLIVACIIRSQLGYSLAIYGNNPHFFHNHNLSGRYVVYFGVVLGHACAAISGFLFAQANGFVDLTMNYGIILVCLTALMLGKLCVPGSTPNILVAILGVFFFFSIQQTLLSLGLNLKYFNAFQASFVLLILYFRHRRQAITLDHLGV